MLDAPLKDVVTVQDMYDMMKSVNNSSKFATREMTIAVALDLLTERGYSATTLEEFERELREKVPLEN